MKAGMVRLRDRAGRYWSLSRWMIRDAASRFLPAMTGALVASVAGVLLQGGVLAIVLIYARHLESGATLHIATWSLDPRSSLAFGAVGSVAALILVAGAVLIYLSKRTIASLSVRYEELCSRRVLECYGVRPQERLASQATRKILRAVLREQGQDARACGRALMTLMGGAHPLVIVLYMSVFLVVLNPETTLFLAGVASLFVYAHYRLNVQVAENEMRLRKLAPRSNLAVRNVLNATLSMGRVHQEIPGRVAEGYGAGHVREYFDRVRLRRMFTARADFLGNILIGVATGAVVIYLGHLALSGALSWGACIAYLVALRIAVSGARSVLNGLAGYARWYPGVRAYRELIAGPRGAGNGGVVVRNRTGRGDIKEVTLQPGDVAAVLSPVEVTRFTLFHFSEVLLDGGDQGTWDFVPARPRLPQGGSLRTLLGNGAGDLEALLAGCPDTRFGEELRTLLSGDADRVLDEDLLGRLDAAQSLKLLLLALRARPARGLFLTATAFAQLAAADRRPWLALFNDRVVFLHYGKEVSAPGPLGEKVVVIGSRAGQVGLASCDWVKKRPQKILDRICVVPREHQAGFDLGAEGDDGELAEGA